MHLYSRAKSISARTDRALDRIGGARRSQGLTLSGEKMSFEGTLEGFERRGEPDKEWQRVPNLRSSNSECPGANASSDTRLCHELLFVWAQCTRGHIRLNEVCQIGRRAVQQKLKCECGDFKVDALPDREPIQGMECVWRVSVAGID